LKIEKLSYFGTFIIFAKKSLILGCREEYMVLDDYVLVLNVFSPHRILSCQV
jgi:hypothetical protein